MTKEKHEVNTYGGRAVFYAIFWESFRVAALECGWTIALHGSMQSDMDMIATPWVEEATTVEILIEKISECIGKTIWKDSHFERHIGKPFGRVVYTLSIFSDYYIDLSIIDLRIVEK